MDLSQLEVFILLCETKNISHTALRLNKTQPAISTKIRLLENELGFSLIERSQGKKSIEITYKGMEFLARAKDLVDHFYLLAEGSQKDSKRLHISSNDSIRTPILTSICADMLKEEGTRICLETHQSSTTNRMVANKLSDIGFVGFREDYSNVITEPIFRQEYYVVRYCENPTSIQTISTRDLDPSKEVYGKWSEDFELWHSQKFPHCEYPIQVDSVEAMAMLLDGTDYWCMVQKQSCREIEERLPLQLYKLLDPPDPRICYMITNKYPDRQNLLTLQSFIKRVKVYAVLNDLTP